MTTQRKKRKKDYWDELFVLIQRYSAANVAQSWLGGKPWEQHAAIIGDVVLKKHSMPTSPKAARGSAP